MKLSFTLEGGLGDFILRYLGSPGNRLASLLKVCEVSLRMEDAQKVGHQLIQGNPFFKQSDLFRSIRGMRNRLPNDISLVHDIGKYQKIPIPLWLNAEEEEVYFGLKLPYAVFHPRASNLARCLTRVFDVHALSQWIADYSGIPLLVVGHEPFGYNSHNVIDLTGIGSPRLACKIIERASFFVGTHSSMQCAASVYNVPMVCIGPTHLLFHDFSAPFSFEEYLQPMFFGGSVFMMFDDAPHFPHFFRQFLSQATSLRPNPDPGLFRQRLALSDRVSLEIEPLSDISYIQNMARSPNSHYLGVSGREQSHNTSHTLYHR
jgi:hypothetical protein